MKTLFSLKKKIGSILVAAAMMLAAVPSIGLAATVETDPELLVNGDFQDYRELETDETIGGSTIPAGAWLPNDWVIEPANNGGEARCDLLGSNYRQLRLIGQGLKAYQDVKGIEPLEHYALDFDFQSQDVSVKVYFMHYDEETDTFMMLEDYVDSYNAQTPDDTSDDIAVMSVMAPGNTGMYDYTFVGGWTKGTRFAASDKLTQVGYTSFAHDSLSFMTPPHTNAVRVEFFGWDGYQTYIDNVSLKKGANHIKDGKLTNYDTNSAGLGKSRYWRSNRIEMVTDENGTYLTSAFHLTSGNISDNWQNVILKTGKTYRYSFKYKSLLEGQEDFAPGVWSTSLAGSALFLPSLKPVGTDGDWTIYEGYYTAANSNNDPLTQVLITPYSKASTGTPVDMWFDDFSLVEAPALETDANGNAQLRWGQDIAQSKAKLLVATYDKATGKLVDVKTVAVGDDTQAGRYYNYVQEMSGDYVCKAFLWNSEVGMKPIVSALNRDVLYRSLPVNETFDTSAALSLEKGWKVFNPSNAGEIKIADQTLVSTERSDGRRVELDLETITSGTVIFEFDARLFTQEYGVNAGFYGNTNGFFDVYNDNGEYITSMKAADRTTFYADDDSGDGAWGGSGDGKSGYSTRILANTMYANDVLCTYKVVVNLDTKTWNVYQKNSSSGQVLQWQNEGSAEGATINRPSSTDFALNKSASKYNISKIVFGLGRAHTIDNLKVYRPEVAPISQTFDSAELSGAWKLNYPALGSYRNGNMTDPGKISVVDGWLVADGGVVTGVAEDDVNIYFRNAEFDFETISEGTVVIEYDLRNRASGFSAGEGANGPTGLLDVYNENNEKLVFLQANDRAHVYANGYGMGNSGNGSLVTNLITLGLCRIRIELDLATSTYKVFQQNITSDGIASGDEVQWAVDGGTGNDGTVFEPTNVFEFKTEGAAANVSKIAVGMRSDDTAIDNLKIYTK